MVDFSLAIACAAVLLLLIAYFCRPTSSPEKFWHGRWGGGPYGRRYWGRGWRGPYWGGYPYWIDVPYY